jgi:hypothetical protein
VSTPMAVARWWMAGVLGFLAVTGLWAQELPRVLVVPMVNATGQAQNDTVAQTTTDTIALTIRLLQRYELISWDESSVTADLAASPAEAADLAARLAEEFAAESVLFGRVSRDAAGTFLFSLSVYDRQSQSVTATNETISTSLFGVFDAADRLVAEAVSAFSGVRVGFGSIRLSPQSSLTYEVFLDGERVGQGVALLERVLIGPREVRIEQLLGDLRRTVYNETVELDEGQTVTITFDVPTVTGEERARATTLVREISAALDLGASLAGVPESIDELSALLAVVPDAAAEGPGVLDYLSRRYGLAQHIARITAGDYGAVAALPLAEAQAVVSELGSPLIEASGASAAELSGLEEWVRTLREDARRGTLILSHLLVLEREGLSREEVPLAGTLDAMLAGHHNRMVDAGVLTRPAPFAETTDGFREFYGDYTRAFERRRPFWHWIAGTLGAVGLAGGVYYQFVEIPAVRESLDAEYERYVSAFSVEEALDARDRVESENAYLGTARIIRSAAAGAGILLPTAIIARIRSSRRPVRIWNEYEDFPGAVAQRAAALDYRERRWEAGEAALLILGEEETVSGPEIGAALTTPVYRTVSPGEVVTIRHESAGSGGATEYRVPVGQGLTVLHLDATGGTR